MKKIFYFLLFFFIFAPTIKAEYEITDYRVNIDVLENGDLHIQEAFKMSGEYNGSERKIYYANNYEGYKFENMVLADKSLYNGSGVVLNEVRAINFSNTLDFLEFKENGDLFKKVNHAIKGSHGVYTSFDIENGLEYKIYNPSKMNKDFYLDYTLKNMVINHQDASELSMFLFNDIDEINNLEITINIKNNKKNLKVWVHDVESKIKIVDKETIKINIANLKNNNLDLRVIFDKNITTSNKKSDVFVLNIVDDVEKNLINVEEGDEEYNQLKEQAYNAVIKTENSFSRNDYNEAYKRVNLLDEKDKLKTDLLIRLMNIEPKIERREDIYKVILTSIMMIWIIIIIIITYQVYKRYDKRYEFRFKRKYFKEIADNSNPAIIGYLIRRKVTDDDLIASILNLIKKKVIIFKKTNKGYIFKKNNIDNLNNSDEKLVKFIFDNKNKISIDEFKQRAKIDYEEFLKSYSNWFNAIDRELDKKHYYEDTLLFKIIGIIFCVIGIILGLFLLDKDTYFSSVIIIIIAIIFLPYFVFLYKRTALGNEEYYYLVGLKKYMKDLNQFEPLEFAELEKYLIFATGFGIDLKLIKNIKISGQYKQKELDYFDNLVNNNKIIKITINSALNLAYSQKKNINYPNEF